MRSPGFQFALLTLSAAAAAYARTAVGPLQEAMRAALSLSDYQMALLQGPALAIPLVLAAVPLGLLIDRYSRARLLCAFAVIDLVGSVATAWVTSFWILFLARCLVGLMVTAISTTCFSLLSDIYPPATRGRASMVVVIGQFGGMSAAFALGGWLLRLESLEQEAWRWALLWLTSPLLVVSVMTMFMREPARTDRAVANPSLRQTWTELRQLARIVLPLGMGIVAAELAIMAVLTWTAPALTRRFSLPADRVSAIVATGLLVSGVIGPLGGGAIADICERWGGPRRTLLALAILAMFSMPLGLFAVMPEVALGGALFVTFAAVVGAIVVAGTALFTVIVPNELRGLCMASLAAACALFGVGLGPLVVSALSDYLGGVESIGSALACVCAVAGGLGGALFVWGSRHFPVAMSRGTTADIAKLPI